MFKLTSVNVLSKQLWMNNRCLPYKSDVKCLSQFAITKLNRSIVFAEGSDTFSFMQKMTTNDVQTDRASIATLLVNDNGRVLCDLIIHRLSGDPFDKELRLNGWTRMNFGRRFMECQMLSKGEQSKQSESLSDQQDDHDLINKFNVDIAPEQLLIECDEQIVQPLIKTIMGRKIRDNIHAHSLPHLNVYAIYPKDITHETYQTYQSIDYSFVNDRAVFTVDPRINYLGYRFVSESNDMNLIKKFASNMLNIDGDRLTEHDLIQYQKYRYELGVPEGLAEYDHAKTFLLETNADYLNQMSIEKGNYVGNVLSSRTYDRDRLFYRLLPFKLIHKTGKKLIHLPKDCKFMYKGKPIGRLIGNIAHDCGMGIFNLNTIAQQLRHAHDQHQFSMPITLCYLDSDIEIKIPFWWPQLNERRKAPLILSNQKFEKRIKQILLWTEQTFKSNVATLK